MSDPLHPKDERWANIPGIDKRYWASDRGRLCSGMRGAFKLMKPSLTQNGYRYTQVRGSDGSHKAMKIHRSVLLAFRGIPAKGLVACHNDGDKENNHLENLRWDTMKSNMADRIKHGTDARGEKCYAAKVTENQVREMFKLKDGGASYSELADRFGLHKDTIKNIIRGVGWKHLGLASKVKKG